MGQVVPGPPLADTVPPPKNFRKIEPLKNISLKSSEVLPNFRVVHTL